MPNNSEVKFLRHHDWSIFSVLNWLDIFSSFSLSNIYCRGHIAPIQMVGLVKIATFRHLSIYNIIFMSGKNGHVTIFWANGLTDCSDFFVRLRYNYPGGNNAILDLPHPQGGPPQPLEKKRREGHLVVKNGTMLHELNSMGSTPPPTGSTLPVWNTGDRLVYNIYERPKWTCSRFLRKWLNRF